MNTGNSNKTVSLVLGSGGARGLAHIGIIHWLNENGYSIQSIAGSSIGALIGGMYAAGKLDVYAKWVMALEKIDVIRLLDISFARKSLFKGDRIIDVLREMIGDYNIEDLPISYTAIATDLHEQQEVWLNQGSLFDAIRASIAIPTIFTPHNYMGKIFLDGSLVNPIPIAPTLNDRTDITIAVNLNGKVQLPVAQEPGIQNKMDSDHDTSNGNGYHQRIIQFINSLQSKQQAPATKDITLYEIIAKSMETMQGKIARYQLAAYSTDAVVVIPTNVCSFYEFYRAKELIDIGYQSATMQLSNL
ncbi:patatin-like phospholipase family protein [Kaarinaea lacus]